MPLNNILIIGRAAPNRPSFSGYAARVTPENEKRTERTIYDISHTGKAEQSAVALRGGRYPPYFHFNIPS